MRNNVFFSLISALVLAALLLPLRPVPALGAACGAPESWETPKEYLQCLASARGQVTTALTLPLVPPLAADADRGQANRDQSGGTSARQQGVTYTVNNDPAPLNALLGRQVVFLGYAVVSSYTIASHEQILQVDAGGSPMLGGLNEMGLPAQTHAVVIQGVAPSNQPGYLTVSLGAFQDSRVEYLFWTQTDGSLGGLATQFFGNTEIMMYSVAVGVDVGAASAQ